jgi:hypothetical protein
MPATEEREYSHAKTGDLDVFLSFLLHNGGILTLVHYGVETLIQSRSANIVHNGRNVGRVIFYGTNNDIVWVNRAEGNIQNILRSGQRVQM